MTIGKNSIVKFSYEMIIIHEDGSRTQQVEESKPMTVMFGRGNLLEPFEMNLFGHKADDRFSFTLLSEDTYGPHKPEAVQTFDRNEILRNTEFEDMEIEEDMFLPMQTDDGIPFNGRVVSISEDQIILDFNHPLAGKNLFFKGKIISVREPTPEELKAGKYIRPSNKKTGKQ